MFDLWSLVLNTDTCDTLRCCTAEDYYAVLDFECTCDKGTTERSETGAQRAGFLVFFFVCFPIPWGSSGTRSSSSQWCSWTLKPWRCGCLRDIDGGWQMAWADFLRIIRFHQQGNIHMYIHVYIYIYCRRSHTGRRVPTTYWFGFLGPPDPLICWSPNCICPPGHCTINVFSQMAAPRFGWICGAMTLKPSASLSRTHCRDECYEPIWTCTGTTRCQVNLPGSIAWKCKCWQGNHNIYIYTYVYVYIYIHIYI